MVYQASAGTRATADGKQRIVSIDAARGAALFLVCLSHFATMYWGADRGASPGISVWLTTISMVATPTFLLISGMMLGFLYHAKRSEFAIVQVTLVDRGLFLVTIGHLLITLAHVPRMPHGEWGRFVFVTDAIAFSIILGPLLIGRLDARNRLLLGIIVYAFAWIVTLAWSPASLLWQLVKDAFTGPYRTNTWNYSFPIMPWFGVYLVGSALGERLGRLYAAGEEGAFEHLAMKLGTAAILLGVMLKLAYWSLTPELVATWGVRLDLIYALSSPWQKLPPGPVYVLLCGGAGLVMLSLIWRAEVAGRFARLLGLAALWGRTSLFLFIVQYYVYYVGLSYWKPEPSPWWPMYFIASLAAMTVAASAWSAHGFNRYLTLGLRALLHDATFTRGGRWHRRDVTVSPTPAEK